MNPENHLTAAQHIVQGTADAARKLENDFVALAATTETDAADSWDRAIVDSSPENLDRALQAQMRRDSVAKLAERLDNEGGALAHAERRTDWPAFFSHAEAAAVGRIEELETQLADARDHLASERAKLTKAGLSVVQAECSTAVEAARRACDMLTNSIAAVTAAKSYAAAHGVGYTQRSPASLLAEIAGAGPRRTWGS